MRELRRTSRVYALGIPLVCSKATDGRTHFREPRASHLGLRLVHIGRRIGRVVVQRLRLLSVSSIGLARIRGADVRFGDGVGVNIQCDLVPSLSSWFVLGVRVGVVDQDGRFVCLIFGFGADDLDRVFVLISAVMILIVVGSCIRVLLEYLWQTAELLPLGGP